MDKCNVIRVLICLISFCVVTKISAKDTFSIAFPAGDYAPHYSNAGDEFSGFLPELMRAFGKDSNVTFTMHALPIKRYQRLLSAGKIDFVMPTNPAWTDNQLQQLYFSAPIMQSTSGFVRLKKDSGKRMKRIATVRAYTVPQLRPKYSTPEAQIVYLKDTETSLDFLEKGRSDAIYGHLDFVSHWLRKRDLDPSYLYFEREAGFDQYTYHMATINQRKLLNQFNRWMLQNSLLVNQLNVKYGVGSDFIMH